MRKALQLAELHWPFSTPGIVRFPSWIAGLHPGGDRCGPGDSVARDRRDLVRWTDSATERLPGSSPASPGRGRADNALAEGGGRSQGLRASVSRRPQVDLRKRAK